MPDIEKKKLYRTALVAEPLFGYFVGECVSVEYRGETQSFGSFFRITKSGGRFSGLVLETSLKNFVL